MNNNISRHEIREVAFQALFPLDFNADLEKKDAIEAVFEMDQTQWLSEDNSAFVPAYLDLLVEGVVAKKEELDEIITSHLQKNWTLKRIAKVDLVILRLAIFEMKFVDEEDVPDRVALNEALELAKKYSDDASRKFINGVLSNVMQSLEEK
ncbi:transcription antitermination factor NusB [Enterococcus timonensis]|uniref:transcription antitermination factor NusB n=1 Tax=Enterococcus timonensis TaxID=1852364 RepID=UPI0008DB2BD9|nr:transcription antitermination factor NusB [Enterococcus timonensis]